ncbi:MAG: nitrogenase component 1 [Pseudomonadota bacterium]
MSKENYVSTTNACKLCTPLGATLAFRGVENAVPFLHGSQGCATYMRRYIISHFREPMDIASSALGEKHAVYGGAPNLKKGLLNVMKKYDPRVIGVASTCLTETIGDDVPRILMEFKKEFGDLDLPEVVHVSTASYKGTHMDGWTNAVCAIAEQLVTEKVADNGSVNLCAGLISPEDIRHLKDIFEHFALTANVLPDISDTLDGQALLDYETIPSGGTPLESIRSMSGAACTLEFGRCLPKKTAGTVLEGRFNVENRRLGMPIGLRESDAFMDTLAELSGRAIPRRYTMERGRFIDAMVDGHKYIAGKRAIVYGEEDLVVGLVSFLSEIGIQPVLAATGARTSQFAKAIEEVSGPLRELPAIHAGVDFHEIAEMAGELKPDIVIGHSKGYRYARDWNVPLVRVGFPIHDRFGGQRLRTLGYGGAQNLYDRIVNAVLTKKQADSVVGYGYL